MPGKPLVIVESPLAGDVPRNEHYARTALLDSLLRGEAPIAFHLLYPQVFDDLDEDQRMEGIFRSMEWQRGAQTLALYCDLGITPGMRTALNFARLTPGVKLDVAYRSIINARAAELTGFRI